MVLRLCSRERTGVSPLGNCVWPNDGMDGVRMRSFIVRFVFVSDTARRVPTFLTCSFPFSVFTFPFVSLLLHHLCRMNLAYLPYLVADGEKGDGCNDEDGEDEMVGWHHGHNGHGFE